MHHFPDSVCLFSLRHLAVHLTRCFFSYLSACNAVFKCLLDVKKKKILFKLRNIIGKTHFRIELLIPKNMFSTESKDILYTDYLKNLWSIKRKQNVFNCFTRSLDVIQKSRCAMYEGKYYSKMQYVLSIIGSLKITQGKATKNCPFLCFL